MTGWTPRQVAMLAEMGIVVLPQRDGSPVAPMGGVTTGAIGVPPAGVPAAMAPALTVSQPTAIVPALTVALPTAVPDGELPAADRLDWPALRDAAAACTACGLCAGRTHSVFGSGRPGAHWLVVGEPPDDADDAAGEAYAAQAGQLLDNMLRAIGVARTSADDADDRTVLPDTAAASITKVVKCRPPNGRPVTAAEVGTCRVHLQRQIALLRPRVVLAMGRWPAHSLLGSDEPLGRLRGRVHRVGGMAVVVTYDPAYLLRNPQDKAKAWVDLCLAAEVAAGASTETAHGTTTSVANAR